VYYFVLWVANCQMLRTTALDEIGRIKKVMIVLGILLWKEELQCDERERTPCRFWRTAVTQHANVMKNNNSNNSNNNNNNNKSNNIPKKIANL